MNPILIHINCAIMYWDYKCEFYIVNDEEIHLAVSNWYIEDYRRDFTNRPAVSF